jgi:CSLREA domain-containing protein
MGRKILRKLGASGLIVMVGWLLSPHRPAYASPIIVNTVIDIDDGRCDSSHCSLHEAINAANANPGPDEILFLFGSGGVHTILVRAPLPGLLEGGTTLDGTRSPYYGGVPPVRIDFSALESGAGLHLASDGNTVRGLSIVGAHTGDGILVDGSRNLIEGNYIGIAPLGEVQYNKTGIRFGTGGSNIARGNLISGNETGIAILGDRQSIVGNIIGLKRDGTAATRFQMRGIDVFSDNNRIGGETEAARNIISGGYIGIYINDGADANVISNNYIGTNAEGTAAVPNELYGIGLGVNTLNTIGGDEPGQGNLISGNGTGIDSQSGMLAIRGNKIGTDAAGTSPIPNGTGIHLRSLGAGTFIGGSSDGMPNLIAFNRGDGIYMYNPENVSILYNVIAHNGGNGIAITGWTVMEEGNKVTVQQNSIFSNGALGIDLMTSFVNRNLPSPYLTTATRLYASGSACPGCRVELFLADPDPSGSGEGKDFLAAANALDDGTFLLRFSDIGACRQLTATATDSYGNTSEFSSNIGAGFCARIPPWTPWALILGGAGGGGGLMFFIAFLPRRRRNPAGRIGLVFLGGLVGAGIAIAILALPSVHVEQPEERQDSLPPAEPACGQFLDETLLQPAEGSVFEPGTDVLFELSPQPDPPGMQTRWFLEVTGPGQDTVSKELTSNSIRLSELAFDPQQTGFYLWTLKGEQSQTGSNLWTPLCQDIVRRMFHIAAPSGRAAANPTGSPTAEATTTPTVTPTLSAPSATLLQNANCRRGPGTDFEVVTNLSQGSNVPIVGRNPDGSWWQVQVPGTQTQCWVAGMTVQTSGDTGGVPEVESPPLGCWVWTGNKNECKIPCPEGAQPGGACTP